MKETLIHTLNNCYKEKRSLLAYNVQNLYHLAAIHQVTSLLRLPVIVQFSSRYVTHLEKRIGFDVLQRKYKNSYIYFHLDHCQDFKLIEFCIQSGFDGVMYDGSASSLDENIKITKKVMACARHTDCIVEGELGEIGGVEDGVGSEEMSYANLSEVKKYVEETEVHLLALGIGNAHGFYRTLKNIDTSILKYAKEIIGGTQLFVLHGGSGLPDKIIRESINNGVVKINYSTQIKQDTNIALQNYLKRGELFNEISFESEMIKALKPLFENQIQKYTSY